MSSAATIIFAREDLSIPGAAENAASAFDRTDAVQDRFFELVDRARPDVIVLDLSRSPANGTETILTILEQTDTPILVVCNPEPSLVHDYRTAGAADCIAAPIDIICLHQAIQHIMRVRGGGRAIANRTRRNFTFAGMSFYPRTQPACCRQRPQHRSDEFGRPAVGALSVEAAGSVHTQRNRRTALWPATQRRRTRH